ncbi:MAG: oligosaccharide flippase family protein [Firmicutes bacterium]|nr:oligosaccharide flippase family protein [Bacillota bacterium]
MINKLPNKYKALSKGVKATLWYTFANLMQKAINVLVVPLYTRLLSTSEYGIYSVFVSWMELFEIVVTFRMFYGAYVVGLVKFDNDKDVYTSTLEKLSCIIITTFLLLYLIFKQYVNQMTELTTSLTLLMFGMMYAVPIVGFWRSRQRVENNYIQMVVVTLLISIFTPLFGLGGIMLFGRHSAYVIYSRVGIEFAIALILLILYKKWFFAKINIKYIKYALAINVPLIPFYLSAVALNHSDRIIIQKLTDFSKAGIYSVAYSASMIMTLFNSAFNNAMQPWIFKEIKNKRYNRIPSVVNMYTIIIAVLNILLIAFAPEAIHIMAPKNYHSAIWIVPPLAGSVYIMAIYHHFTNIEFFFNESKIAAFVSIGSALLNIGLNFLLIPVFGYMVAGYTTLFSYLLFLGTHYFCAKYVCKKNNCPFNIFDMKSIVFVSIVFFILSALLAIGYLVPVLRYIFIVSLILICLWKKDYFFELIGILKEK